MVPKPSARRPRSGRGGRGRGHPKEADGEVYVVDQRGLCAQRGVMVGIGQGGLEVGDSAPSAGIQHLVNRVHERTRTAIDKQRWVETREEKRIQKTVSKKTRRRK